MKCYFSHPLTSREHSQTQADVFKFKHATAVTGRCEQHTAQTPLSHCLMNFSRREKKKKLKRSQKLFGLRHSLGAALAFRFFVKCPLLAQLKYFNIGNTGIKTAKFKFYIKFRCWKNRIGPKRH